MWLVDRVDGGDGAERHAFVCKTHHALVDGISGMDIMSVLFDSADLGAGGPQWTPRPVPSSAFLLADAAADRALEPLQAVRSALRTVAAPQSAARGAGRLP